MTRPLFFTQTYFHEHTPVDENTNYNVIQPVIWDCQELTIQDILGTPLYNELKHQIVSNTVTALNATLIEKYINPCLLKYVMHESQVSLLYKFRNKSVMQERSDFGNPVSFEEHRYLKDYYKVQAEAYAMKIQEYLKAKGDDYPLYYTYTNSDEVRAQNQKPTVSVWLKGMNDNC